MDLVEGQSTLEDAADSVLQQGGKLLLSLLDVLQLEVEVSKRWKESCGEKRSQPSTKGMRRARGKGERVK